MLSNKWKFHRLIKETYVSYTNKMCLLFVWQNHDNIPNRAAIPAKPIM